MLILSLSSLVISRLQLSFRVQQPHPRLLVTPQLTHGSNSLITPGSSPYIAFALTT
jgi:hypothetical protein